MDEAGAAVGDGGDEKVAGGAVFAAYALNFGADLSLGGVGSVHDGGIYTALQCHASADLLLELYNVVLGENTLPYIDAKVDHILNYGLAEAVGVVDDYNTLLLEILVALLVCGLDDLTPELWLNEEVGFAAPVVMGEDGVGMSIFNHKLEAVVAVFADSHAQVGHKLGLQHKVAESVLKAHEEVKALKYAGGCKAGDKLLTAVNCVAALNIGSPELFGRAVGDKIRNLYDVFPFLNVVKDLVKGVGSGGNFVCGPENTGAPLVEAGLHAGIAVAADKGADGITGQHSHILILLHKAVGLAAADGFKKILSLAKHNVPPD